MKKSSDNLREWRQISQIEYPDSLSNAERSQMERNSVKTEVYTFLYSPENGISVRGYAVLPVDHNEKNFPAILYARGGYGTLGKISHYLLFTTLSELANKGYAVIATDYRDVLDSPDDEVADLLTLKEVARTLSNVDTSRLALMGVSRGGLVVYRALTQISWAKAAVTIAGLADLQEAVERRPDTKSMLNDHYANDLSGYSAVNWPELFLVTPLLLLHGAEDARVAVSDSQNLYDALKERGRPVRLVIYNGASHYLEEVEDKYLEEIHRWLQQFL